MADAVHALMRACAREMRWRGFHNWDTPPTPARLAALAATRTLLVVRPMPDAGRALAADTLAGAVFVGPSPVRPYDQALAAGDVCWATPDGVPVAYVNALAVHPAYQGRGLGATLMQATEREAQAWGAQAMRLDALAANTPLLDFYARLGYGIRGRRVHDGWAFACLERRSTPGGDA